MTSVMRWKRRMAACALVTMTAGIGFMLAATPAAPAPAAAAPAKGSPEARLEELAITLPPVPKPMASYVPVVRSGNLLFLAGQGPIAPCRNTRA